MGREELLTLGAIVLRNGRTRFRVWAPHVKRIDLVLSGSGRVEPMIPLECGYYETILDGAPPGTQYMFRLDGERDRPDPCSRFQPDGVHQASEVVGRDFEWTDAAFQPQPLREAVFHELHIGAFTEEGTFDAAISDLDRLVELGITHVEVMPVAAFPGTRNWGYDGVSPFATQASYGGPVAFRRFVNACHERGLGVALDVVYNHLGPEGNFLGEFGPYFTGKYHTPWGDAVNFDGPHSDEVRRYFIESALSWMIDYHIDALRVDAVHAIFDQSAYPFLHELTDRVHEAADRLGRRVLVIAESDLNDPRLIRTDERGGYAMDGQWADDFHHALHAMLTGERNGYYADFGTVTHLARAMQNGYVYEGQYSTYRQCRHGARPHHVADEQFIVCAQNHDQVGNRRDSDRLTTLISFEACKVAAATILLSPFTPLLFMGEEYGETSPFLYFVSHSDPELIKAVREGRAREFAAFAWHGELPDPQAEDTFRRSRLDRTKRSSAQGRAMEAFYGELIRLRRELCEKELLDRTCWTVTADDESCLLFVTANSGKPAAAQVAQIFMCFNFQKNTQSFDLPTFIAEPRLRLDSSDERWGGGGGVSPQMPSATDHSPIEITGESMVLYQAIRT